MEGLEGYVTEAVSLIRKGESLVFTFQSAANKGESQYVLPIRCADMTVICGICNYQVEDVEEVFRLVDKHVSVYLIDSDVKHKLKGNLAGNTVEGTLRTLGTKKRIEYFSSTCLTIETLTRLIRKTRDELGIGSTKKRLGFIGFGRIAQALTVARREVVGEMYVTTTKLDVEMDRFAKVSCLNRINTGDVEQVLTESDIVLSSVSNEYWRDITDIPRGNGYLLSLDPVGCDERKRFEDKGWALRYVCVDLEIQRLVSGIMSSTGLDLGPIRKELGRGWVVSGGYPAEIGDIVVDNADRPRFILGKMSENGFVRSFARFSDG